MSSIDTLLTSTSLQDSNTNNSATKISNLESLFTRRLGKTQVVKGIYLDSFTLFSRWDTTYHKQIINPEDMDEPSAVEESFEAIYTTLDFYDQMWYKPSISASSHTFEISLTTQDDDSIIEIQPGYGS